MGLELEKRAVALDAAKRASRHGWPIINRTCVGAQ
jgi:hypothetical protein